MNIIEAHIVSCVATVRRLESELASISETLRSALATITMEQNISVALQLRVDLYKAGLRRLKQQKYYGNAITIADIEEIENTKEIT